MLCESILSHAIQSIVCVCLCSAVSDASLVKSLFCPVLVLLLSVCVSDRESAASTVPGKVSESLESPLLLSLLLFLLFLF